MRREEDYRAGFAAGLMAYREELGLPAIGAIEAAAAAANAETPFEVLDANTHGGHKGDHGDDGDEYTAAVAETPDESSGSEDEGDGFIPVAELAGGQGDSSSLTDAGAAALARAVERRSLSRSQSLDKGQVAEKLSEVELFEVPLGK